MKLDYIIFAILLAVLSASAESGESKEIETFILEQAKLCQKETNATDTDLKEMLDGAEAKTKVAECLHSCLLRKLGVMNEGNKLEPEKLRKLILDDTIKSKDGKTITSVLKQLSDACKSITDSDRCKAGTLIIACLNKEAVKLGFEDPTF